jgi:hypothetical protein
MFKVLWIYCSAMILMALDTKLEKWNGIIWKKLRKSQKLYEINWIKVKERYGKCRKFKINVGEYAKLEIDGVVRGMTESGIIAVCADLIKHANAKI